MGAELFYHLLFIIFYFISLRSILSNPVCCACSLGPHPAPVSSFPPPLLLCDDPNYARRRQ